MARKEKILNMQSVFPDKLSKRVQAARVHAHDTLGEQVRSIVIGFYAPPHDKRAAFEELDLIVTSIQRKHPEDTITIVGDLNST
jgi:hypothetical protein